MRITQQELDLANELALYLFRYDVVEVIADLPERFKRILSEEELSSLGEVTASELQNSLAARLLR